MINQDCFIALRYTLTTTINFICSVLIFLFVEKIKIKLLKLVPIIIGCILSVSICTFLRICDFSLYGIVFIIILTSVFIIINKPSLNTIIIGLLSIGITFCIELLCAFLLSIIFYTFGYYKIDLFTESTSAVLQLFLTFLLIKTKRLKNGFVFLRDKNNYGLCIFISGLSISFTILQKEHFDNYVLTIIAIILLVSCFGLFIWIRSAFTRHYRKRLKARAEEYSKIELAEKNIEIEKLLNENASLSSIIHLDNYLINKLETTLQNKNDDAINNLLALTKQRNDFVNNKIISDKILPTTGNSEIDAVLTDMYIKVASRGIDFTLNVDCDINYFIHNIIEQAEFEELIRNCITNSIVDIENNPDAVGKILITISKPNDIYEFTIMDNGVVKDENIKSISQIIEKSKASIKTNTFENNDSFTKSLTIRFDGLKNNTAL